MIPSPKTTRKTKVLALLLLAATPALGAQTAVVRGTPQTHAGPSAAAPLTGTLPQGATVTLEQCSGDGLVGALSRTPLPRPQPGAGDWCLVRGVGWVEAGALVDISADPKTLLPGMDLLDPLKDAAPSWDDLADPAD